MKWVLLVSLAVAAFGQEFRPEIRKIWDDKIMETLELPLASGLRAKHVPADYYYRIPERKVYKTYPIYPPDREPAGYFEHLKTLEPELAFDAAKLKTKDDWIRAGEQVFHSAKAFTSTNFPFTQVRNPEWWTATEAKLAKDGTLPYYRYVIRKKGKVEVTFDSCASCHSRVLDDGQVVWGAAGSIAFGKHWAYQIRKSGKTSGPATELLKLFFGAPWIQPDPLGDFSSMTLEDVATHLASIPHGVGARQGTSLRAPAHPPDLIGIADRKYLDNTGLQLHRSIEDIMRYAAINNFVEELTLYGDFRPISIIHSSKSDELPKPETESRSSDSDLYALALYIYSLQPPQEPESERCEGAVGQEGVCPGGVSPVPSCTDLYEQQVGASQRIQGACGASHHL
ncbi:MAG: hypothetical protein FJW36_08755 [Acidobacteria bacterium]|nr:hypothetical protein [Acidobacteriota bacterium]